MFAATVASALVAIGLGCVPIDTALAQTPGTAGAISLGEVFDGEGSVDTTPEGKRRFKEVTQGAHSRGNCPRATVTVVVKKGDETFQKALVQARRDALLQTLGDQARNFLFETDINGTRNDVRVEPGTPRDTVPPALNVTWAPPKGTKVKAGDRITAKAVARDDANLWQTGINTIDLNVDGGGSFGFEDFPRPPLTCERPPPPRTLEGVYRVPANPPPVVRLRVIAKDFAGNETELWAEFPTGDWYGGIKKQVKGGGHNHRINIDYAFEIERNGTLKGRSRAKIATEAGEVPGCTMLWSYSPSEFDIPLSGRRDGENFEIALEPGTLTATIRLAGPCAAGQASNTFPSHLNPAVYAATKYRIAAQDGATNTVERSSGALPWGSNMRDTITIHQARH
jgi:hypothetical protein